MAELCQKENEETTKDVIGKDVLGDLDQGKLGGTSGPPSREVDERR